MVVINKLSRVFGLQSWHGEQQWIRSCYHWRVSYWPEKRPAATRSQLSSSGSRRKSTGARAKHGRLAGGIQSCRVSLTPDYGGFGLCLALPSDHGHLPSSSPRQLLFLPQNRYQISPSPPPTRRFFFDSHRPYCLDLLLVILYGTKARDTTAGARTD